MALVRAGATHVYAVEDSCIITQTRKIIAANNMEDKITLIDVSMKEVRLPGPVDVLVSMWMGEALLYKCSLADVLFARDRWLKADGIMFPSRASLYLVGIEMPMATEHEFWWSNVRDVIVCICTRFAHDFLVPNRHSSSPPCPFLPLLSLLSSFSFSFAMMIYNRA